MDLTSVLRDEIFRPAVTLVCPGGLAIMPYVALGLFEFPWVWLFLESHLGYFTAVYIVASILAGLVLDSMGAWLENLLDENRMQQKGYEEHLKNLRTFS